MRRHVFPIVFAACLCVSVLPLWVARHLPAVDLPQHLFLIHVLGHLADPSLPYSSTFIARPGLTYLTFYYSVRALASLVGVEAALKVGLTVVLAGIPLAMLSLLRALGKSPWLALLTLPLLYTDNFYWGLVSFLSSLPLTILVLACFIVALEVPRSDRRRSRWALAGTAVSLALLQLTHAAGMLFPSIALPLLFLATPSDTPRRLRALAALTPGIALFGAWLLAGVNTGRQMGAPGEPWKASAPLFDARNFVFHSWRDKLPRLPELLSNGFWSWADRPPITAWAAAALLTLVLGLAFRAPEGSRPRAMLRAVLLFAAALGAYLLLPHDISGYMYAIYPRYAQVAALLAIPLLPFPSGRWAKVCAAFAVCVAIYAGVNLCVLFRRFDREAESFERIAQEVPARARVMHLVVSWDSREATHAVYLHYAALAALRVNGLPSFSLATDPSFPVGYRPGAKPPASPWEWRPTETTWEQARWYDVYLTRGDLPAQTLFRGHADDVELVSRADLWRLYRRKPGR